MLDVTKLLEEIKASPYEEMDITAPHTGVVEFSKMAPGARVMGPSGAWKELPGTRLATIEREENKKSICSPQNGSVVEFYTDLEGAFVEAGTPLARIRHFLSKEEVLRAILLKALYVFNAPDRAKYYFVPNVEMKVKTSGPKSVTVNDGMDLFIMSRMKREVSLKYTGPSGVIYAVYFQPNENVDAGGPLIGVCPPDLLTQVEDVVIRVQTEWEEQE